MNQEGVNKFKVIEFMTKHILIQPRSIISLFCTGITFSAEEFSAEYPLCSNCAIRRCLCLPKAAARSLAWLYSTPFRAFFLMHTSCFSLSSGFSFKVSLLQSMSQKNESSLSYAISGLRVNTLSKHSVKNYRKLSEALH